MKRRQPRMHVLTDGQISQVEAGVRNLLGSELIARAQSRRINLADTIRLNVLGAACAAARQEKHLSLKEAASAIAAPQYRVRAIERGQLGEILPNVLRSYVAFLGLESEVACWARQNRRLAVCLGLLAGSGRRRGPVT